MELRRGVQLIDQNATEAVRVITAVTEMAPNFAESWNQRGTAFLAMREYNASIDDYSRCLALKPKHFGCLEGLGVSYLKQGSFQQAMKWMRAALEVHPGLSSVQQIVEKLEIQTKVEEHLQPQIDKVMEAFKLRESVPWVSIDELSCTWDVHRMMSGSTSAHVYFFRVRIRNQSPGPCPVQSVARFYVAKFANGKVLPLTRPTPGEAQFKLDAGEEHKFSWALIVSTELSEMAMGVLLERSDKCNSGGTDRFLSAGYPPVQLTETPLAQLGEEKQLSRGYVYMGQLDLRGWQLDDA